MNFTEIKNYYRGNEKKIYQNQRENGQSQQHIKIYFIFL